MQVYKVTYFDDCEGEICSKLIKAFDSDDACERVCVLFDETEVISVELVGVAL